MNKKKLTVPHVYILLLGLILIFSVLTYIVPAGQYDMQTITVPETGAQRSVVDASTYHTVEATPVTLMKFLTSVPRGMQEAAQIIFFLFVLGGSMKILTTTKAIDAGVGRLIRRMQGKSIALVPLFVILFSTCGATFGMCEETIAFVPIFIPIFMAMGFDSITGAGIVLCGCGAGYAAAFLNPFNVGISQGIAELPLGSGMGFRLVMFSCMTIAVTLFMLAYALKIKKNPEKSLMYEADKNRVDSMNLDDLPEFEWREKTILVVFVLSIVLLIVGVVKLGWYIDELAALFFGMSMIVGIIAKDMGLNRYAELFGRGMAEMAVGALVVGFARGVLVVMTDGQIIHTILHSAAGVLQNLPAAVSAIGMYIFQCLLNFIVPSASGQAAVSVPILAPLGDLVDVTRQTTCIAFQLGDGISNILTPTSGYFMAALAAGKIPWAKWAKWILPLIGIEYLIGAVFVIAAQMMNLGPF